jgi:putative SOS response-associated peptidase YedK
MCGRFSLNITLEQIQQHFPVDIITCKIEPRPEVFPSQQVPALIMSESKIRLGHLTWGLIPSWAREKKGTGHINARMESLNQKPSFRDSFRKRRCLIIADGFYEWKADPENNNRKTRYYFQLPKANRLHLPGYGIPGRRTIMAAPLSPGMRQERSGIYIIGCRVF